MKIVKLTLFEIRRGLSIPCGLSIWDKLWWRFMPGVTINVRWPKGDVIVNHDHPLWQDMGGAVWINLGESADPNDHYRPWLEKHVGRQSWDWNWGMFDDDVAKNRLTIKIRRARANYATMLALKWS